MIPHDAKFNSGTIHFSHEPRFNDLAENTKKRHLFFCPKPYLWCLRLAFPNRLPFPKLAHFTGIANVNVVVVSVIIVLLVVIIVVVLRFVCSPLLLLLLQVLFAVASPLLYALTLSCLDLRWSMR